MKSLLILTIILITQIAFADNRDEQRAKEIVDAHFSAPLEQRYGFSGSASARYRYQENSSGRKTHDRVQSRLVIDAYIALNESGCLKARGQLTSGSKFDSVWDETGIGDTDHSDLHINLRRLYLDMACYQKYAVLVGAIPPFSGDLGLKDDGWVDGVRVSILVDEAKKVRIYLTAGEVDEFTTANAFKRKYSGGNYYQLAVDGKLSDRVSFVADFTDHDTNEYMRTALKFAVKDLTTLVDSIGLENVTANSEKLSFMFSLDKQIGAWKTKLSTTDVRDAQLNAGTLPLPTEDFYGKGRNYQASFARDLSKHWVLKLRFRDGDAGKRFEVRMDYKFDL